ncbi:hypothetical protein HPB52_002153 [Rhipicephalus sanguineus]|uniref:Uncharacterized protein n=1 Tax=Rhipicephalus sanguineus TaxID=34632 RepID=A0A9D4Q4F3_RHISA|nr:hypothetical protein HPB52_002153 [Rhipicephalus sanguineus]
MFNSLFVTGGSTLIPPYKSHLTHFVDTASHHSKTEYGIGIDHKKTRETHGLDKIFIVFFVIIVSISLCDLELCGKKAVKLSRDAIRIAVLKRNETFMSALVAEQATKTSLDEMWSHRVYHYGQVNTPPILTGFDTFQYVTQSAKGLQVRVISALKTLKKEWPNTTALAVSLGMGGRWYLPAFPDRDIDIPGNYTLGHHCKKASRGDAPPRPQISSIAECCEDPNYNETFSFDSIFQAMFAYDKSDYMLFTYDSAASFRLKVGSSAADLV